eukprot:9317195-Heterocapsa_arctica.AAC.1
MIGRAHYWLNQACVDQGYQRPPHKEVEALRGNQPCLLIVRTELGPMLGVTDAPLRTNYGKPSVAGTTQSIRY